LQQTVEQTVAGLGYDLVEIERSAGGLLRVTIDLPWSGPTSDQVASKAPEVPEAYVTVEDCEKVISSFENCPSVEHGGGRACYMPSEDRILMPPKPAFTSSEEYYSTLFHELVHATGANHRLARKGVTDPSGFASHEYSFEELVAECGSTFLCSHAGIAPATLANSAAYIASWSKRLSAEPRWIVNAASQAGKAADLILGKRREQAERLDEAA